MSNDFPQLFRFKIETWKMEKENILYKLVELKLLVNLWINRTVSSSPNLVEKTLFETSFQASYYTKKLLITKFSHIKTIGLDFTFC